MSIEAKRDTIHYTDWLTLLGFQSEKIALRYVKSQAVEHLSSDEEWLAKIRRAIAAVEKLQDRSNIKPKLEQLDEKFGQRVESVENGATFQEHLVGMKSSRFVLLELATIRCHQLQLSSEYIDSLVASAPEPQDLEGAMRFCLPTPNERASIQVITSFNAGTSTFSATADNLDMRIVGVSQGEDEKTGRNLVTFSYGFGLREISVVEYRGSYILKNGYHRAYALYKKGHKYIPCLLLSTDNPQYTGATTAGSDIFDLVISNKGPILSDFGTDAAVCVPRRRVRAIASFHAEVQAVPI